ncbi:MAG TPA: hypothetical protein PLK94_10000 [Alphaproteobacteria bacterium]|nr:hypothetical protein [Alphaproteobacteria bacterium]
MPNRFSSPVNLRKKTSPVISIYGDLEDKRVTNTIWELIPGFDVSVSTPQTLDELIEEAYNSAVVYVVVDEATSENLEIADKLSAVPGVVADIIAITREPDIRKRLHILSAKFDAIYNLEILDTEDFSQIFIHKLKKGSLVFMPDCKKMNITPF